MRNISTYKYILAAAHDVTQQPRIRFTKNCTSVAAVQRPGQMAAVVNKGQLAEDNWRCKISTVAKSALNIWKVRIMDK